MAFSDYTGRSPAGYDDGTVIGRVSRHHRWNVDAESTAECAACGAELRLDERHLLVTLAAQPSLSPTDRRHLCDETCLRTWLDED